MKVKIKIKEIIIVMLIFIITKQIKNYLLVMLFALLHELGHLICGIILKFKLEVLNIMPFGFSIKFKPKCDNKKVIINRIITSLSGPIINLVILIIGQCLSVPENIIYINFLLAIFNLIPIYPLDGGKILKNIFKIKYGNIKANTYINKISNITIIIITAISSFVILSIKNIAIFLIVIFLWKIVLNENKRYRIYSRAHKILEQEKNT